MLECYSFTIQALIQGYYMNLKSTQRRDTGQIPVQGLFRGIQFYQSNHDVIMNQSAIS